ncbi:MAG: tetratricopeptide repeat protein [Sphingomicrobium sp.]
MAVIASALAPVAAGATALSANDPLRTYVQARAAAIGGNHRQAAELLAALAQNQPDGDLARKAFAEALGAGQFDLALRLARAVPPTKLTTDARLLLIADEMRNRRTDRALSLLATSKEAGDLSFLAPLISAWDAAEAGSADRALAALDQIGTGSMLSPLAAEQRALILLKFKRSADAEPFARRAVGSAGAREDRLRLAFADGFLQAGDKARALMIIDGIGSGALAAQARIQAGRTGGQAIDTGAEALSEALTAFSADLARMQHVAPPIGLIQAARYADPRNVGATALLALLLNQQDRSNEALALLGAIDRNDPLISPVRDIQVRILVDQKRFTEAYQIAALAVAGPAVDPDDYSRLGEVYAAMKRFDLAADAYRRAIVAASAGGAKESQWGLHLLHASALEDAHRWPESKAALAQGLALSPDQPLLLNFLGYAKLERGEDVEGAETMIRKASELAPDDASIIDSLGWAQFKRGKVTDAIGTLQRAAEKDPAQAEIQEHLGDALFQSGRHYEARFAWGAALITAEDDMAGRIKAKLANGLMPANAAP